MKLYYVVNALIPHKKAYAIQIAKMCEAFVEEGVDLELIIPRQNGATSDIKEYYNLRVPISVKRLHALNFYASSKWGYFLSSSIFIISYSLYFLSKIIRGEKGIIYTIDMDTFSFVFLPYFGMPCFLETHGGKAGNFLNKIFFKRAKGVIAINNIIKKQIDKTVNFPENKILVWPNGIDLNLFREISKEEARKKLTLPKEGKIVMYSGRFYGWKGLEVLVDAVDKLPVDVSVYIVGGTKEEFMAITKKGKLPDNLIFFGEKHYVDIPLWLSAADSLLVLGTKYDTQSYMYTSPMKVFEYLAMKRQIVASKTPAICDIVSDEHVIFYEPDNAADLARKMQLSVSADPLIKRKPVVAFELAVNFTWRKRAGNIIRFIEAKK